MKGRSCLARGRLIAVEKREVGVMDAREADANAHRRPAHFYLLKAKGVSQSHASLKAKCSVSGFPRINFCRLLGRSWHFLKAKNTSVSSFVPGSCLSAPSATAFFLL